MRIVPAPQIIQPRLLVVDIPPISERIELAQRACQRACRAQRFSPCIVLVFYHKDSVAVNNSHYIARKSILRKHPKDHIRIQQTIKHKFGQGSFGNDPGFILPDHAQGEFTQQIHIFLNGFVGNAQIIFETVPNFV